MATAPNHADPQQEQRLCLACGFCCDGTLFLRVRVQPEEPVEALLAADLEVVSDGENGHIMRQPCRGFRNGQCQTYDCRPRRCGEFRCPLLASVAQCRLHEAEALAIIQDVKALRDDWDARWKVLFPESASSGLAETMRRFRKETRKLRGERLRQFRDQRRHWHRLRDQLQRLLDQHFYPHATDRPEENGASESQATTGSFMSEENTNG